MSCAEALSKENSDAVDLDRNRTGLTIAAGIGAAVLLYVGVHVAASWQVRNGAAQVAESLAASEILDDVSLRWDCNGYTATFAVPPGITPTAHLAALTVQLRELGFEQLTRRHYQQPRGDDLDANEVIFDPIGDDDTELVAHLSVFDLDSSWCLAPMFAKTIDR